MAAMIGTTVVIRFEQVEVFCRIHDVKKVYGRVRLHVSPVEGNRVQWVDLDRAIFPGDEEILF